MGDPKKKHKLYSTPKRPYDPAVLEAELRLIGAYGLRNKRELWRHHALARAYRRRAREMLSMDQVDRADIERKFKGKLHKLGFIDERGNLDDIQISSLVYEA